MSGRVVALLDSAYALWWYVLILRDWGVGEGDDLAQRQLVKLLSQADVLSLHGG